MRCGRLSNNGLLKLIKFCFVFLVLVNGAFSVACQSKPRDAASILLPCQELISKDDIQAAGKCYEAALLSNPQQAGEIEEVFTKSFFEKCLEFKEKKNYQQAIICLEGLSVLAPDSANVQLQLASSYYQYHETRLYDDFELLGRAEAAIKRSLEINPEIAIAQLTYGEILRKKGNLGDALKAYQETVKLAPKDDFYWMQLALFQEKKGDSSSALISYHQVLLLDSKNTLAIYNSAKLYEKTGNRDKAIENYEKLLEIKDEYDDARERLENLKKQKNFKMPKGAIYGVPSSPQR